MRRTCICWLMALLPLLASYASVRAVERLSIDAGVDTTYLPYRLVTLQDNHESNRGAQLNRLAYIIEPGRGDSSQALILKIYNDHRPDYPAIIGMGRSPLYELVDDDAVPLTVRFWDVYRDNGTDSTTVCGAGHRNDSAFLFRLDPYTDQRRLLFLMTGEDATGDSAWVPNLEILSIVDYDYDGRHEAFVYVNRERDAGQRTLFCIEMEAMRIEWQLEVASPLSRNAGFWNCGDSTRPAVAFVGMCRGQGAQDANFDDHHGFFAVVDTSGKLIHQRVLSHKSDGVLLAPGELPGCAYLGHSFREPLSYDSVLALERAGMADTLTGDGFWISKVNREGEIVHTGRLDAAPLNVWLRPLGSDHCPAVHVLCNDFRVRVFDTSLTLLAQSEPCLIERIWAKSRLPGGDSILFCGDGIYTTDLKRIAYYPGGSQCEPLTFDDHGGVLTVLLQSGPRMMLARLEERGFLDLAVIFYVNNKAYFLMIVSGLVVGLLAMNYYRRRSQRNLVLIASQKKELEETHAALKRAQAQLVAQAKYEQAQDIAGGVAHEIRNALSPARNALGRILVDLDARKIDPDTLTRLTDLSERSVARAVDLTRLISEYSRLDTKIEELPVSPAAIMAEVLEAYREEADEARVRIQADIPPHATVPGNKDQLSIVFVNLLRNALEALAGRTDPRLTISGEDTGHDLLITVTDNGPGIAPDTIDRVFEIFYSTKPSTGTGVGLAMTRRILELYGGTISAANAPTGGAVFCLRLPTIS